MKKFLLLLTGVVWLIVAAGAAQAQQLRWNVGTAGAPSFGDTDALTGAFNQIEFYAQTSSDQFDNDGNSAVSAGDQFIDAGDMRVRALLASAFIDAEGLNQSGGYEVTSHWSDVKGHVTGVSVDPVSGDTRIDVVYTGGTISLYLDRSLDSRFANPGETTTPTGAGGSGFENGTLIATLSLKNGIGHTFLDPTGVDVVNQGSAEFQLEFTYGLHGFWYDSTGTQVLDPVGYTMTALIDMNIDSPKQVFGNADLLYTAYSNEDGSILVNATRCTAAIGDYVWHDLNRNSLQDAGEPGINGIVVNLMDAVGTIIASTATGLGPDGQHGYYQFSGLCAGNYEVASVPPAGFSRTPLCSADQTIGNDSNGEDTTCNDPAPVTLITDNESNQTIDFGFVSPCTGTIGDFVWEDLNGDGFQGVGEPGIDGVTINLKNYGGTQIATTSTGVGPQGQHGYYQFTGLCAGDYQVEVITPGDYFPTKPCSADQTVADDSNCSPALVTLPWDDSFNQSIDFGFIKPACIGDYVWEDLNADGIQDANEPGLNVVSVNLLDCAGNIFATTNTASMPGGPPGYYQFCGLYPGGYNVQFVRPDGYVFTLQDQGANDAVDSDSDRTTGQTACTTITSGEIDRTWDAGLYRPVCLGDYVWDDYNRNGVQDDGEPGIGGVRVDLLDCAGNLDATTTTDASGRYNFCGLIPGGYTVQFHVPADYAFSPSYQGSNPALDSNANPPSGSSECVILASGQNNYTVDAGLYALCNGSIGNYAWVDANMDGLQEADELPLPGVTVELWKNDVHVASSLTAANGFYQFAGLCPGTYVVKAITPGNYLPTPVCVITEDVDGDANCSPQTVVSTNNTNDTIDFGFYRAAPCIDIEKFTNGADADDPHSPNDFPQIIPAGVVNWSYVVKNCGNVALDNLTVMDNRGVVVICPKTSLAAGESMTCTGSGIAADLSTSNLRGFCGNYPDYQLYENLGIASGSYLGQLVEDVDPSHYCNPPDPAIDIEKYTNGEDADLPTGPMIPVGGAVNWTYVVTNTGNVPLSNVTVTDDQGTTVSCPKTALAMGESMTCTANGIAVAGQYANIGTTTGDFNGQTVTDADPSHYKGYIPCTGVIGNFIWVDADRNGIQDIDETPLGGVTVELWMGSAMEASSTSNAVGFYQFANLCPGTYEVRVIAPAGYLPTPTCFNSENVDGDANCSPQTVVSDNGSNNTIDFGFFKSSYGCTFTIGYWKNHAGFGPQSDVVTPLLPQYLGNFAGSKTITVNTARIAYDILGQNVFGTSLNGITKLYAQLLAAKLSIKAGADPSMVATIITAADNFLASKNYNDWSTMSVEDRGRVDSWHAQLDDYNNGMLGPDHCESPTEVPCIDIKKMISVDGGRTWLDADSEATAATRSSSGTVYYKLIVKNCGLVDLTNIRIKDPALGISDYIISSLAAGMSKTLTSSQISKLTVYGQCSTAGSFENVATAEAIYGDIIVAASDSAWLKCNNTNICIDIIKDVSVDGGSTWSPADTHTAAPTTSVPKGADYRVTVRNCGSSTLSNVTIRDEALDISNYSVGTLSAGSSKVFTYRQISKLRDADACENPGAFSNTARVTGTYSGKTATDSDIAWLICEAATSGGCSYTWGYWKTHTMYDGDKKRNSTWDKVPNGNENALFFDTGQSWFEVLMSEPSDGNAYYILAHQYAAAYLNKLSGADTSSIDRYLQHAFDLLDQYDGNPQIMSDVSGNVRDDFVYTASILDDYNEGDIGPGHCQ